MRQHSEHARDGAGHTEEDKNQPDISPPIVEVHVQRLVVLVPDRDRAIPAKGRFGRIVQVTTKVLNEIVRPRHARLAKWWVKHGKFFRLAGNFEAAGKREGKQRLERGLLPSLEVRWNALKFGGEH